MPLNFGDNAAGMAAKPAPKASASPAGSTVTAPTSSKQLGLWLVLGVVVYLAVKG